MDIITNGNSQFTIQFKNAFILFKEKEFARENIILM
jgi:hypothetical protein